MLPFPYPGSPWGDYLLVSTLPTTQTLPHLPLEALPCSMPSVSPFSFAPMCPGLRCVSPVGLLSRSVSLLLNRFLFYKHRLSIIHTHSSILHVKYGRHFPTAFIPLGPFYLQLIMPGPMRRTPSYKASDLLTTEYRRPQTPDSTSLVFHD